MKLNTGLVIIALTGFGLLVAGSLVARPLASALTTAGGVLMGFALGFYLARRTVLETLRREP